MLHAIKGLNKVIL